MSLAVVAGDEKNERPRKTDKSRTLKKQEVDQENPGFAIFTACIVYTIVVETDN